MISIETKNSLGKTRIIKGFCSEWGYTYIEVIKGTVGTLFYKAHRTVRGKIAKNKEELSKN